MTDNYVLFEVKVDRLQSALSMEILKRIPKAKCKTPDLFDSFDTISRLCVYCDDFIGFMVRITV